MKEEVKDAETEVQVTSRGSKRKGGVITYGKNEGGLLGGGGI